MLRQYIDALFLQWIILQLNIFQNRITSLFKVMQPGFNLHVVVVLGGLQLKSIVSALVRDKSIGE